MTPREHVEATGTELDAETKAKLLLIFEHVSEPETLRFSDPLRYTSLGDIAEFCEANA